MSLEEFFGTFCHQLAERCLRFDGEPLPLCARCTGLFCGFGVVGLVVVFCLAGRRRPALAWWIMGGAPLLLSMCLVDGLTGASDAVSNGNAVRFLLGLGAGLGAAAVLVDFSREWMGRRRAGIGIESSPPALAAGLIALALVWEYGAAAGVVAWLAAFGFACYVVLGVLAVVETGRRVVARRT